MSQEACLYTLVILHLGNITVSFVNFSKNYNCNVLKKRCRGK